ncbi:aldehyde dehydrogenase (NADP()) [Comamonas thiooxydans]|uniref:aldehyde dehydrogenase (NADP(+)) n=1 Tax=Comamonas thiooxydans TaxID=363952 RepID=UPI000A2DE147|nr:aldehyde dehydrogenase (NADP(+)) [Comamonas thiooxydans]BDR09309.1 aldehyde dehydrogenase (NADP()) [Comamonas thiooxydans]
MLEPIAVNLHTSEQQYLPCPESSKQEIDISVGRAAAAAIPFSLLNSHARADFLEALARALELHRNTLIALANNETGLELPRLHSELDRTTFQLRRFSALLRDGVCEYASNDAAVSGAPPASRPRLTKIRVPIGPVAMFSASNFPFAFSVLGGDTASALAAGCPVVVKGHPGHPKLSRATIILAEQVVREQGLPPGVIQFVHGNSTDVGVMLVESDAIAAVAFTGSFRGGMALAKVAGARARPIPFYGELGSVNPLVVLPSALEGNQAASLAEALANSICMGSGQFCTSPGVIVVGQDAQGDAFVHALASCLSALSPHGMLSTGIRAGFEDGIRRWRSIAKLKVLVDSSNARHPHPGPFLGEVTSIDFLEDHRLHEEVFGSAALVVRVASVDEAAAVLNAIGGSLTVTLWGVPSGQDCPDGPTEHLVRTAQAVAGRVLFSGVPTGVAVTRAQHHGGPFPASTAPFTTSVGDDALDRFLRPLALQDAPEWLLARYRLHS